MPHKAADPEIIKVLLKQEIIRLGIQNNPSRTVYQDRYHRGEAPSPNSAMQITKMSWSDLMHDLGFRSSPKCWCKLNSANLSFHKLKHTGFF